MRVGTCRTSVGVFSPSDGGAPVLTNADVYEVTNTIGKMMQHRLYSPQLSVFQPPYCVAVSKQPIR